MIKLFSGSANKKLSQKISQILKIPLSNSQVVRFDNSEVRVTIKENVKNSTSIIIQSTSNPTDTHLMELFFFADALKRGGAKEIVAFIPYFGYARQNREHTPGEAVSANVVIRFLETIGFNAVYTINLHDEGTEGIFSITFKNLSAFNILSSFIKKYLIENNFIDSKNFLDSTVIVSPDQGGVERAQDFSDLFFEGKIKDIAVVEKKRNLEKIHESKALNIYGDVKNKICIIVDDIITSGGTLVHASDLCLEKKAKKVFACIVHHDFSSSAKKILEKSSIEKIFTTDTIFLKENQKFKKLEEVSIAPLIAEEIRSKFLS
ncbi:MAG: ribose-phosphate pyrophosphokinase [Patescibacteria group bacterium]|nr:ribose-phosphate pyrophosphokinase [Patescibacteria group bacterium]